VERVEHESNWISIAHWTLEFSFDMVQRVSMGTGVSDARRFFWDSRLLRPDQRVLMTRNRPAFAYPDANQPADADRVRAARASASNS
jgi:hypothetical protein